MPTEVYNVTQETFVKTDYLSDPVLHATKMKAIVCVVRELPV